MNIYEFMEDFDNSELSEEEWTEQMEEAVREHDEMYPPLFERNIKRTIRNYLLWKNERED